MQIKDILKKITLIHKLGALFNKLYLNSFLGMLDSFKVFLRKLMTKDKRPLSKYADIHEGERCFIVATGPSLTFDDLDLIKDETSFSMNSIIKILDKTKWRPKYYGIQDPFVYEKLKDLILKEKRIPNMFIADSIAKKFDVPPRCELMPMHYLKQRYVYEGQKYITKFSSDASLCVYSGYTITYSMIQLAVYMGFKEIYLLGCDSNYCKDPKKQHFVESGFVDPNFSTAAYKMMFAYVEAKKYADAHNVKIYNATRGGMLEVFPRVKLEDVIMTGRENEAT